MKTVPYTECESETNENYYCYYYLIVLERALAHVWHCRFMRFRSESRENKIRIRIVQISRLPRLLCVCACVLIGLCCARRPTFGNS